jgi:hypothetical protein
MKLLYSAHSGVLVLATPQEYAEILREVEQFLNSGDETRTIDAEWPTELLDRQSSLRGIELKKAEGLLRIEISDGHLVTHGDPKHLGRFFGFMNFPTNAASGAHHHPELVEEHYIGQPAIATIFEVE